MTTKSPRRIGGVWVLLGFFLKVTVRFKQLVRSVRRLWKEKATVAVLVWALVVGGALLVGGSLVGGPMANSQDRWADNTMFKKRVVPNATARRAGSAIDWENRLEQALEKSAATGKPVFWYVPRLPDTFMDRVESIDFYMKAGPFSWPRIVDLINENFVPVATVPTAAAQKQFGVETFKFIEPGILVLKSDRSGGNHKAVHVLDRLTTMHIPWLEHRITQFADHSKKTDSGHVNRVTPELGQIWRSFSERDYRETVRLCQTQSNESADGVERELIWAMAQFRMGQQEEATARFQRIAQAHPEHPLGHKAATEGQGIGPFVRGFEVHNIIPDAAYALPDREKGGLGDLIYGVSELRQRGVDYLLGMQNQNGGFFDSDYDFGGTDSLPNVHVAITAVTGLALLQEYRRTIEPDRKERLAQAVIGAAHYIADDGNLNLRDRDELFWAYAYRLELWTQIEALEQALLGAEESKACVRRCVRDLVQIQSVSGNWFHEYSNPFVTAMGVLALHGSQLGEVDASVALAMSKGCEKLAQQRGRNGAFPYDDRSMGNLGKRKLSVIGAAGRMPLCEAALWSGGKSSQSNLNQAIETSFRFHSKMESAYKYDDHTSVYGYGGFFYWFDMRGRKQAIDLLPESDAKTDFQNRLRTIVVSKAEIDGCFVDSHEIGRCYGTAMALLCLGD